MDIYNEGGINWNWFTELSVNEDNSSVEILRHYRLHLGESWDKKNIDAERHPRFYHIDIWKEGEGRIAIAYNHPVYGWLPISNPKYIFDYK